MQGRDYNKQYITPHKMERDRVYRVVIFSKDVESGGNWSNGLYNVNLDDIPYPNQYHVAIESWTMSTANNITKPTPFFVELTDINQPDSYSTSSDTNSKIALLAQVSSTWGGIQNSIVSSTIGIPLSDTNILKNKQLRIQLKGPDDTTGSLYTSLGAATSWIMVLLVYRFNP